MVNNLNRCASILTDSGSSNYSENLNRFCQRRCRNECCQCQCQCQCNFINERTYTIFRKICRKMIKGYNRSQCRQRYTLLNGGNSINVQIRRSISGGGRQSDSMLNSKQLRHNATQGNKTETVGSSSIDKKQKRTAGKLGSDDNVSYRRKDHKRDEQLNILSDEANRRTGQKAKGRKEKGDGKYTDRDGYETTEKQRKNKQNFLKASADDDSKEVMLKEKRNLGRELERKGKKTKQVKEGKEHDNDDKNLSTIGKRGVKERRDNDVYDDNAIGKSRRSSKKKGRKSKSIDYNNLEKKHSNKLRKSTQLKDSQNRQLKPSRADEVKTCDYLRAYMEQRDLCQLVCNLHSRPRSSCTGILQTCATLNSGYSCCTKLICNVNS